MNSCFFYLSSMKRFHFLLHAIHGIRQLILTERNVRIHLAALLIVCGAAWYFEINRNEWYVLLFASALVLITETINTALEKLCDFITGEYHPAIKQVKDIAAGAVLLSAIFALISGVLVFWKHVL